VLVVPSLHVVAAVSAAAAGKDNAKIINGAAIRPATVLFFILAPLFDSGQAIVNRLSRHALTLQRGGRSGTMLMTSIKNRV
jgi:hypothetical protein